MENHHLLTKRAMASRAVLNYKKILRRGLIHIYIYRESDLVTKGSDLIWTHGMGQAAWGTGTGLAHKDPHGNGPCYICVSAGLPLPSWRFYFFFLCFYAFQHVSTRLEMIPYDQALWLQGSSKHRCGVTVPMNFRRTRFRWTTYQTSNLRSWNAKSCGGRSFQENTCSQSFSWGITENPAEYDD